MRSSDIEEAIRPREVSGPVGDIDYGRVVVDSRRAAPGSLFVALRGKRTDGHRFIDDAVGRGATGVVCERAPDGEPAFRCFVVDDSLRALYRLGHAKRETFGGRVVAVTGSNGKTTTKEFIASVLGRRYRVRKSEENMNTMIGLSITLFGLTEDHDILVVEMGTNHRGEIAEITGLVKPHVGVITNVSPAHLEGFGSVATVLREKGTLLTLLPPDGTAVVGGDDRRLPDFARRLNVPVRTFGLKNGNDYRARNLVLDGFGRPSFMIDGGTLVKLSAIGEHNAANAMAAVAVGNVFDLEDDDIARGLEEAGVPEMRTQLVEQGGVRLLVDCYNANPASMRSSLRTLSSIKARRRIAVLGPMAELGRRSRELHRQVGEEAVRSGIDILIGVGERAQCYLEGAENYAGRRGKKSLDLRLFETVEETSDALSTLLAEGDIVLFKASRSAELERLVRMIREGGGPEQDRPRE